MVKDVSNSKQHQNYLSDFGARKDTILDMVSHNLSGPLNLTNNLLDRIDQVTQEHQFKRLSMPVRLIRENNQHCIELINSFLKEEHYASPGISVESKRYDILAKINVIIERYRQFAPEKRIKVESDARQLFVTGDDVKFFQVVNNLISNSVKFTDTKGKITVTVNTTVDTFSITVKDDGIGIPEYLQPLIFKKNTPAGRPGLRGEKSIGMGLHIVKKLVELMGGTITYESEENKGAKFSVQFPKDY